MICKETTLLTRLMFCWPASWYIRTIWTNRIHYLLSIYVNNQPLHVASRLIAHHQEVLLCMYSNWCMSCVYVDWMLAGSDPANNRYVHDESTDLLDPKSLLHVPTSWAPSTGKCNNSRTAGPGPLCSSRTMLLQQATYSFVLNTPNVPLG
jgi:hypothetical protein